MKEDQTIDLMGYDAWRISRDGEIEVRDEGLWTGGETEGRWFCIGTLTLDPGLINELVADPWLKPVGRYASYYTVQEGE